MMPYIVPAELSTLGHDITVIDPADLEGICQRASDMIDGHVSMTFVPSDTLEVQTAHKVGSLIKIFPNQLPVISVKRVSLTRYDTSVSVVESGFILNNDGGSVMFPMFDFNANFPVVLEYRHGYNAMPADIKQATLMTAKPLLDEYVATKLAGMGGVKSVSDGGRSVSTMGNVIEIPQAAKDLLAKYGRVR